MWAEACLLQMCWLSTSTARMLGTESTQSDAESCQSSTDAGCKWMQVLTTFILMALLLPLPSWRVSVFWRHPQVKVFGHHWSSMWNIIRITHELSLCVCTTTFCVGFPVQWDSLHGYKLYVHILSHTLSWLFIISFFPRYLYAAFSQAVRGLPKGADNTN